jgi:acyl-CoA synthetase (AMP-forming)/AMP-acid ligase II
MVEYPWLRNYDQGVPLTLEPYPDITFLDVIEKNAKERSRSAMMWFKGSTISYGRFAKLVDSLGKALAGVGVKKGDTVALLMPNCPQIVISQFAVWKAGGIAAQVNPLYSDELQGEAVKAWVVLKPDKQCTPQEIQSFCKERLTAYKVPKHVEFRNDLPKSMVGKVLRRILQEEETAKQKSK